VADKYPRKNKTLTKTKNSYALPQFYLIKIKLSMVFLFCRILSFIVTDQQSYDMLYIGPSVHLQTTSHENCWKFILYISWIIRLSIDEIML